MHALDVLGDPVRRRILELLANDELSSGEIDQWLERFSGHWEPTLDALATEVARGKRTRRQLKE